MLAWLMVCDPPEQSAEDLATALQASAGGVSTNVRLLMHMRFVERTGKAGERRAYYRTTPYVWSQAMAYQEQAVTELREYTDRGLQVLANADPERTQRLTDMRDFLSFMEREMPALRQRYDEKRGSTI